MTTRAAAITPTRPAGMSPWANATMSIRICSSTESADVRTIVEALRME